jgi:hypothetical protein
MGKRSAKQMVSKTAMAPVLSDHTVAVESKVTTV